MNASAKRGWRATGILPVLAAVACSGLLAGQLAWAQDDYDAGQDAAKQAAARVVGAPQIRIADMERWLFGGKSPTLVKRTIMSRFTLQVESVDRACSLSDAQRKKLELAAHGDVQRFFRHVDEIRNKFGDVGNDQEKLNKLMQQIHPIQTKVNSTFFDDNSLLYKVLRVTLDREQSLKYEKQQQERRLFQYEAKIELALAMLENGVPLREQQRRQFVKLLLEETQPPRKFGQYDHYVVFYQASKLKEAKLRPIFDDAQWRAVKQMLSRGKSMERFLKSNGLIP